VISDYFDEYDKGQKGYLTLVECKKFFAMLLELDYSKAKDRVTFRKILKLVDIDNNKVAMKDAVIQFFTLPNFLEVIVNQEQEMPHNVTVNDEDLYRSESVNSEWVPLNRHDADDMDERRGSLFS
jgi:hypothetical protein